MIPKCEWKPLKELLNLINSGPRMLHNILMTDASIFDLNCISPIYKRCWSATKPERVQSKSLQPERVHILCGMQWQWMLTKTGSEIFYFQNYSYAGSYEKHIFSKTGLWLTELTLPLISSGLPSKIVSSWLSVNRPGQQDLQVWHHPIFFSGAMLSWMLKRDNHIPWMSWETSSLTRYTISITIQISSPRSSKTLWKGWTSV